MGKMKKNFSGLCWTVNIHAFTTRKVSVGRGEAQFSDIVNGKELQFLALQSLLLIQLTKACVAPST